MSRTELLQEVRKMRFEEIYGIWEEGRLTQEEAARVLGVCARTFRRYIDRYEEGGVEGLGDKRLERLVKGWGGMVGCQDYWVQRNLHEERAENGRRM